MLYEDTNLINGNTYSYKVSAVNSAGEGALSQPASAMAVGPPSMPENVFASPGNLFVILTWNPPLNNGGAPITSYKVYRGTSSYGEAFLVSVSSSVFTYNDTVVSPGVTYYYRISAVNSGGEGAMSIEVYATPYTHASAPRNLVATSGNNSITLTWNPPISDGGSTIISYDILRDTSPGVTSWYITVDGSMLSFVDTGVVSGVKYYYAVRTVNAAGYSPLSNEVNATAKGTPGAPVLLSAVGGSRKVTLTWAVPLSDGGSPITSYQIWRGTSPENMVFLVSVSGSATSGTDWWATPGVNYYYKVRAVNAAGPGAFSNTLNATATSSSPGVPFDTPPVPPVYPVYGVMIFIALLVTAIATSLRRVHPYRSMCLG